MSVSVRKEATWKPFPWPVLRGSLPEAFAYFSSLPLIGTLLALLALLVLSGVILAGIVLFVLLGPVPVPKELASATAASSNVYAPDGSLLATWHGPINRQPVSLDQISPNLAKAVVAEEDARFYADPGVDWRSILRAAITDFKAGKVLEGGSTLTQQYVKVAYVGDKPSLGRKILEARVALKLTSQLSKDQIMARYLNTVYFGDGAYGAQAAAQTYFGEDASQLSVAQAALLAGIIHSPDNHSPVQNPGAAEADRQRVIGRMQKLGSISAAQADTARAAKTVLATPAPADLNLAWYMDALRTSMLSRYGAARVYTGGLQIHTTLDPAMQASAQASVQAALPNAADPYSALVAIDPATGYVRAIVGGRDYATSKFNIATLGRRQPGSAFKPFVLAAALEQGISPQATYSGPSTLCPKGWAPGCVSNFSGESFGTISLLDATVFSVNTVYAQVMLQVGPKNVVDIARRMGIPAPADVVPPLVNCRPIDGPACRTDLPALPSLALGSAGVTPLEMASAYATLAAGGVYRAPKLVSRVTTGSGQVLEDGPSNPVQAIPATVAQEETQILQQVIVRGTGTAANIGQPAAAGKTGTAQNFDNAWFVGYTPTLAASVWVGYPDSNRPLLNVEGVAQVSGGTIPAKIWSGYMQAAQDTSTPTLALDATPALDDGALTNQTSPTFSGLATDDAGKVVAVQASVDGAPYATDGVTCRGCPSAKVSWTYRPATPWSDGGHTLSIRSVNQGGYASPALVRHITVDTVPPTTGSLKAKGGSAALSAAFSKPMSCASLAPRQFQVQVAGRYASVASVTCDGVADASVTLNLAAPLRGGDQVQVSVGGSYSGQPTDQAGNPLVGSGVFQDTASNALPQLSVTGGTPSGALTSDSRPQLQGTATDPDGNVSALQASVDGGPFDAAGMTCPACRYGAAVGQTVDWSWRPPVSLSDGPHRIAVQTVDNAGGLSAPVTQTVTIDTVPPIPSGLAATGGEAALQATFSKAMLCSSLNPASFTASVAGHSVGVSDLGCKGKASPGLAVTLASPPRGGDQVWLSVSVAAVGGPTDLAGNHLAVPTVSATATNVAPGLQVTGGTAPGALVSDPQPAYQGQATDRDGTVAAIEASIDGGAFQRNGVSCSDCLTGAGIGVPVSWSWRAPARLADGTHSIVLRSVDNAAATSAAVTQTVTVDTVAPKATGLHATGGGAAVSVTFSKALLCSSLHATDFSATLGSETDPVMEVSCKGSASGTIAYTLVNPVRGGDQVVLTASPAATDQAGNPIAGKITGVAVNAPPVIALTDASAPTVFTANTRPTYLGSAQDRDGSVAAVQVSIDGGQFTTAGMACGGCLPVGSPGPIASPVSWSWSSPYRLGDGTHTIALRSLDSGGATSAPIVQTVVIDSSVPQIKAVLASPQSDVVSVIFSKPIACASLDVGKFNVAVAGAAVPVTMVNCTGNADAVIGLALPQAPGAGATLSVSISRGVTDDAGNALRLPATAGTVADSARSDLP